AIFGVAANFRRCQLQRPFILSRCARHGVADELRADLEVDGYVLLGLDALFEVAAPPFEGVVPGDDCVFVATQLAHDERRAPAIIDQWLHERLDPTGCTLAAVEQGT